MKTEDSTEVSPKECQCCEKITSDGETVYDIGWVCQDCLANAVDKTGYCSMSCQLFGECDGSC